MAEPTELKTDRLLLRSSRFEDVDDVYAYASDPEWGRYLLFPVPRPYTRKNAEEFIAKQVIGDWSTNPHFAIVHESVVIGGIELNIKARDEVAGLGYGLSKEHWGNGYTPEAAQAVVDWGFTEHGLAKIYARADLRNLRSTRAMEKLGMTREAVLRSQRKGRGERIDEVYYAILREEWEANHG